MKELSTLLIGLLVSVNGQIIFPAQYEAIRRAYAQRMNASGYRTRPSPFVNGNGFARPIGNDRANDETFYPIVSRPASINGEVYGSQIYDHEARYWSAHVNNILAKGVTKFALDIDRAIYRSLGETKPGERPNFIISPLNIAATLAVILAASAGLTFVQVAKILGLESGVDISLHSEAVHQMFGLVLKSIDARPNTLGPRVTMASGIFVQDGYPIRDQFKAISREAYDNEVINLDFMGQPDRSSRIVNDWVNTKTQGKISSILDRPTDPNTRVIIASALYFSGEWNRFFIPEATGRRPFSVTPNETVMVDMMFNTGIFPFYEDKRLGVQIVGFAYKGYDDAENNGLPPKHRATMYVMLPTAEDINALSRLESRLTADKLENMLGKMMNRMCILGLPRMKLSSTIDLNEALQSMGLASLFDSRESNLGLLSPGHGEAATSGRTSVVARFAGEDDEAKPKNRGNADRTSKNNCFRYEDKNGGYNVEQWDSDVLNEKILSSLHRKRSIDERRSEDETTNEKRSETYEIPINSTESEKLRIAEFGKFDWITRLKRQGRAIDDEFVRFVESRGRFKNFGLDALRNSPNLGNPGLFTSSVLHKVEMDVTETGTTAAAATGTKIVRGGSIQRLIADRPFLFFIRHERSKLMLFWGAVHKPTPSY